MAYRRAHLLKANESATEDKKLNSLFIRILTRLQNSISVNWPSCSSSFYRRFYFNFFNLIIDYITFVWVYCVQYPILCTFWLHLDILSLHLYHKYGFNHCLEIGSQQNKRIFLSSLYIDIRTLRLVQFSCDKAAVAFLFTVVFTVGFLNT